MTISLPKLYDLLSTKIGKETAEKLTIFIEEKITAEMESKMANLVTKDDLAKSNGLIVAEVSHKISESKAEMLKWMFIFWAGQSATTIGIMMVVINKLL